MSHYTSVLKKLGQFSGDSAFILKTPTVNAGVRGTSFHASTDGTSTYFCTCNGSVALDDPDGGNAEVLTKDAPFRYYSRELVMSVRARAVFVEPDLRPLP